MADEPEDPYREQRRLYLRQHDLQKDAPVPRAVYFRGLCIGRRNALENAVHDEEVEPEPACALDDHAEQVVIQPEVVHQPEHNGQ